MFMACSHYLLVKTRTVYPTTESTAALKDADDASLYVPLDPCHPLTMGSMKVQIPEQTHRLQMLLEARRAEEPENETFDDEDEGVLRGTSVSASQTQKHEKNGSSNGDQGHVQRVAEDWQHSGNW